MQELPDDFVDNTDPPTVPSTMQEEEEKKVDEADKTPDVEKAVITPYDAIQASDNNYLRRRTSQKVLLVRRARQPQSSQSRSAQSLQNLLAHHCPRRGTHLRPQHCRLSYR
eukprot:scaffold1673_cov99-Skeletonema_marinoi.AAC.2